ncbi:protein DUF167 [Candidatus Termititenax persephonae]|uniref:UPF0235 protein NO2_1147 n=1 Tax=Candidatus Termititenax persephonae TaxID=2218525 RepID=A0A388TI44_9BACT|nr:protein DUF167 [Candidatus Termititenax persephonae]
MKQKIPLYVQPGARKTEFAGYFDGKMKIKLKAPAQENKANQELIDFLAQRLAISKSQLAIIQGLTGRHKVVAIDSVLSFADINDAIIRP